MANNIDILNAPNGVMTASQGQSEEGTEPGMVLIWSVGAVIVGLSMAIGLNGWFS